MERAGPAEQARAALEPRVPSGAWVGARRRPALLLLSFDRTGRLAVLVSGWRPGGGGHGAADVRGRCAPLPPVAAVPPRLRVQGITGYWLWEAGVGRTRRRTSLSPVAQGLLV